MEYVFSRTDLNKSVCEIYSVNNLIEFLETHGKYFYFDSMSFEYYETSSVYQEFMIIKNLHIETIFFFKFRTSSFPLVENPSSDIFGKHLYHLIVDQNQNSHVANLHATQINAMFEDGVANIYELPHFYEVKNYSKCYAYLSCGVDDFAGVVYYADANARDEHSTFLKFNNEYKYSNMQLFPDEHNERVCYDGALYSRVEFPIDGVMQNKDGVFPLFIVTKHKMLALQIV